MLLVLVLVSGADSVIGIGIDSVIGIGIGHWCSQWLLVLVRSG